MTKKRAIKVLARGSASTTKTRQTPTPPQLQPILSTTMPTTRPPSRTVPLATAKTETPHVPPLSAEQEDAVEVVLPVEPEAEAEAEGTA